MNQVTNSWQSFIEQQSQQPYYVKLQQQLDELEQQGRVIYPVKADRFAAFELTPLEKVKVVIIGQDPYHQAGQAHGLSFSVNPGVKVPPSLRNMYKELAQDISGFDTPESGDLRHWAQQGVLLLNTVLTVEDSKPNSHKGLGWLTFTNKVIETLNSQREGLVFLLWGANAQSYQKLIDNNKHHILTAPHPSPLSAHRGFFGCRHFSTANQLLLNSGQTAINW